MASCSPRVIFALGMIAGMAITMALFALATSVVLVEPLFDIRGGLRGRPSDANHTEYRSPGRREHGYTAAKSAICGADKGVSKTAK